jgi:hypothetical protein
MTNAAPTDLAEILSADWLTSVLSAVYPGAAVDRVSIVEEIVTTAHKVRFAVEYRTSMGPEVPRKFCVKGFFGPDAPRYRSTAAAASEAFFYRDLAPGLSVRLPQCVYAAVDAGTQHGIIVMKDLVADGARFLTALEPYSLRQATATLDQLARLHAASWNGREFDRLSWLKPQLQQLATVPIMPPSKLQTLLEGPRGKPLPSVIKDADRIYRALRALSERLSRETTCVVHGDAHAGNVFEQSEGPGLIDWQLVQSGCWALDVAYHIGAVLNVEERERSERALLTHYCDRLRAHGATPPAPDHAWLLYRMGAIYGYYLWGITQRVVPEVTEEFVRRLGSAVVAHDSFGLLGT